MSWKCDGCDKQYLEDNHRQVLFATMSEGFVGPCCFSKYSVKIASEDKRWSGFIPQEEVAMWTKSDADYHLVI